MTANDHRPDDPLASIRPLRAADDARKSTVALGETADVGETANLDRQLESGADATHDSGSHAIMVVEPNSEGEAGSTTGPQTSRKPLAGTGYELRQQIGTGGMGEVWEACQRSLGRAVALKRLRPGKSRTRSVLDQFESEARFAGALDHPNIVTIHEYGHDQSGRVFYTMKLIEGTPWDRVIGDGERETKSGERVEVELRDHLEILIEVSQAIAFAHSRGVIHRDIKPGNVMIGDYGEVLVVDWGLAVAVHDRTELGGDSTWTVAKLPRSALICGTPAYMAPETATATRQKIGIATDVYLLGAVLFHLLYGQPPHGGKNVKEVITKAKVNAWTIPRRLPAMIKPWDALLRSVVTQALATDPRQRFCDAGAFADALRRAIRNYDSAHVASRAQDKLDELDPRAVGSADGYQALSALIAQLDGALESWPRNLAARQALAEAHLELAGLALDNGDLALAKVSIENYEQLPPLPEPEPKRPLRRLTIHPVDGTLVGAPRPSDSLVAVGVSEDWTAAPSGEQRSPEMARTLTAEEIVSERRAIELAVTGSTGVVADSATALQIQQESSASMVDGEARMLARAVGLRHRVELRERDARQRRRALVTAGCLSAALLVALCVVLGAGVAAVHRERNAAQEERELLSRALLEETADTIAAQLTLQFRPVTRALMTSARWAEAGSLDDDDPNALNHYFIPLLAEVDAASSMLRADSFGHEYMLLHRTHGGADGWRTRTTVPGELPQLREWSPDGQLRESSTGAKPYDPHQRPWYRGGLALRATGAIERARDQGLSRPVFWTEPYAFYTTGELGISVSTPATSLSGREFVLAFDIKLGALSELTAQLPEDLVTGQVFILDDQFRVLGVPREVDESPERRAALALTPMDALDQAPISRAAFVEWRRDHYRPGQPGSAATDPFRLELPGGQRYWVDVRKVDAALPPVWIGVVAPEAGGVL